MGSFKGNKNCITTARTLNIGDSGFESPIYIGSGGDLSVVPIGQTEAVVFKNVGNSTFLPVICSEVKSVGTTATDILKLSSEQGVVFDSDRTYIDRDGSGGEFKSLDPFYYNMSIYNPVDEHWYFTAMTKGGVPYNRATELFKVNSNLQVVDSYLIPLDPSVTSAYDTHPNSVIDVDASGNIYVVKEKGRNSAANSDAHGADWVLFKLNIGDDLDQLTLIKTIPGVFSYPDLWVNGVNINIGGRGYSVSNQKIYSLNASSDSGVNFTERLVFDNGGTLSRAYTNTIEDYDGNDMLVVHTPRNDGVGNFYGVHLMKSTDGVNWSNWQETFTKDVVATSPLTNAEILTNCVIWEETTNNYESCVNFEGGVYKDGQLRILVSKSERHAVIVDGNCEQTFNELRLYTYNGGWTYTDITELLPVNYRHIWAFQRVIQLNWDADNDYIIVVDKTGVNDKLIQYKSGDLFTTYTTKTIETYTDEDIYYGAQNMNATTGSERMLTMIDGYGGIGEFDETANLIIYKNLQ